MAHAWLRPVEGLPFLTPAEVLARVREAFAEVDGDPDEGADQVSALVANLLRLREAGAADPEAVAARLARLEAGRGEALYVSAADSTGPGDAWIGFTLVPGEPLFVGFVSPDHEAAARPLLARCAAALGYVIDRG